MTFNKLWNLAKQRNDLELIQLVGDALNEYSDVLAQRNRLRADVQSNPERYAFLAGVEVAYDWPVGEPYDDSAFDYAIEQWLIENQIDKSCHVVCESAFRRGVNTLVYGGDTYTSVELAALRKGVKPETIQAILSNQERRQLIFPSSRKIHEGLRAPWEISIRELDAWTPANRGRPSNK